LPSLTASNSGRRLFSLWVNSVPAYPNPAGLKRVQVDAFIRALFTIGNGAAAARSQGADRITTWKTSGPDGRPQGKDFVKVELATILSFATARLRPSGALLLFYPRPRPRKEQAQKKNDCFVPHSAPKTAEFTACSYILTDVSSRAE